MSGDRAKGKGLPHLLRGRTHLPSRQQTPPTKRSFQSLQVCKTIIRGREVQRTLQDPPQEMTKFSWMRKIRLLLTTVVTAVEPVLVRSNDRQWQWLKTVAAMKGRKLDGSNSVPAPPQGETLLPVTTLAKPSGIQQKQIETVQLEPEQVESTRAMPAEAKTTQSKPKRGKAQPAKVRAFKASTPPSRPLPSLIRISETAEDPSNSKDFNLELPDSMSDATSTETSSSGYEFINIVNDLNVIATEYHHDTICYSGI